MSHGQVFIPYGGYWCTPFSKWQGSFATAEPIPFAAEIARRAIDERGIDGKVFDGICLGTTIPSRGSFYGAPWLAGLMGLDTITGPTISQACATSARCLAYGAEQLSTGAAQIFLAVAADRTSNGPHIYYPDPSGPGGTGKSENWVLDNFGRDPLARCAMVVTAENVARASEISRQEQEEVTLLRHQQYQRALGDDSAFLRRFMVTPVEVKSARGKVLASVSGDEGVFPTDAEKLSRLRPVVEGGSVTFGTQTHPADGNAGMILTSRERARELAQEPGIEIQLLAAGQGRVARAMMPQANVPAARQALDRAGLAVDELAAVTTHLPFAVGDVYLSRELGIPLERMNRYGCSLIWGHPQAPTGLRAVIELIEDLAATGGGYGLFTGCAAGDTAMALVLKVSVS